MPDIAGQKAATPMLALCYLGIVVEGFDLGAGGQIAGKVAHFFGLTSAALGFSFSINALGLLIGAISGGWLADRFGRKAVVIGCFALFGLLSIATAFTTGTDAYLVARFLTGLGLGGSVPNLIAIAAELGGVSRRISRVATLSSGLPLGGALCGGLTLMLPKDYDWRLIVVVGGVAPIILAALFLFGISVARQAASRSRPPVRSLFTDNRSRVTVCLWAAFFLTMLTLALMLNWLPTLIVGKGHSPRGAAVAGAMFSLAGAVGGVVLGFAIDRVNRLLVFLGAYAAVILGLTVIAASAQSLSFAILGSAIVGFFLNAAQTTLYGLAPGLYPFPVRATGVGFAVAAGRSGSIAGPMLAGVVLQAGGSPSLVMAIMAPCMAIALAALVPVLRTVPRTVEPGTAQA